MNFIYNASVSIINPSHLITLTLVKQKTNRKLRRLYTFFLNKIKKHRLFLSFFFHVSFPTKKKKSVTRPFQVTKNDSYEPVPFSLSKT